MTIQQVVLKLTLVGPVLAFFPNAKHQGQEKLVSLLESLRYDLAKDQTYNLSMQSYFPASNPCNTQGILRQISGANIHTHTTTMCLYLYRVSICTMNIPKNVVKCLKVSTGQRIFYAGLCLADNSHKISSSIFSKKEYFRMFIFV